MWRHLSWRDILPSALMLAVLTIYFELATAIIVLAVLGVSVAKARRDLGPRP